MVSRKPWAGSPTSLATQTPMWKEMSISYSTTAHDRSQVRDGVRCARDDCQVHGALYVLYADGRVEDFEVGDGPIYRGPGRCGTAETRPCGTGWRWRGLYRHAPLMEVA